LGSVVVVVVVTGAGGEAGPCRWPGSLISNEVLILFGFLVVEKVFLNLMTADERRVESLLGTGTAEGGTLILSV